MNLDEMNLEQVNQRLAEMDEEVRGMAKVEDVEAATENKKALLERQAELFNLEQRKQNALDLAASAVTGQKIEERKEVKHMENRVLTPDMPEYRNAFLKTLMGKPLSEIEQREYISTTTGLAVVPTETANMIFDVMTKIAPMLNEITLMRVAGGLRFAVQGTRNAAAVHVENAPTGPAADTLTVVTLGAFEFIKVLSISASMQSMAVSAFESWLVKILAEDIADVIDDEIINTTSTTGGIIDGPGGGWVNGTNQVTYVPANGLTNSDILDLMSYLPTAYHYNAKWLMNNATFYGQVLAMEDANGNPLHKNAIDAAGVARIYGKEVLLDDHVAANEAYFGDFTKVVGNLSTDIRIDKSAEAGFLNASTFYRGLVGFDCDVADPAAIVKLNV